MTQLILGIIYSGYSGQFQTAGSAVLPAIEPSQEMTVSAESIVAVPVNSLMSSKRKRRKDLLIKSGIFVNPMARSYVCTLIECHFIYSAQKTCNSRRAVPISSTSFAPTN
jgi:hypothetical protein